MTTPMTILSVGNLPSNRLALTNKVYISPSTYNLLFNSTTSTTYKSSNGVSSSSFNNNNPENNNHHTNQSPPLLLSVGGPSSLYAAESNPAVPNDQIALNGLQRRYSRFSLSARVEVRPYTPNASGALVSLEFAVDLLAKRTNAHNNNNTNTKTPPREIDTDRLASDVFQNYNGHMLGVGQILATDFEGTKVELTVHALTRMDAMNNESNPTPDVDVVPMGQFLSHTELTFRGAKGTSLVSLSGTRVSSGGGGAGSHTSIFTSDFDFEKLGIGGLDAEFERIFRRAFASRIWPGHVMKQMGISHVRGMLLYGPPGCGKTLIARQIGRALNAREPKIVNGPEILNKYVGGSEEKIRELFAEAEKEQMEAGDASMLHIIILDEMDAICKSRGTVRDGTGVSDSVVNQLLSKIDGVDSLNNILLIGMTNRKDMIDDALLRPGRLEVHVEIGLPDTNGRIQILNIHTKSMKESNRLTPEVLEKLPLIAEKTKNFSGAELEGLIKAASSYALTRCVDVKDLSKAPDAKKLVLRYEDLEKALGDVEPKFGAKSQELKALYRNGFVNYGTSFSSLLGIMNRLVEQVRTSNKTPLMTCLLTGPIGCGKSAIAANVGVTSEFPFVRMISADEMIGYSESSKCQLIHKAFLDSYKSPLSLLLIDDIERIIDYVPIGPRFSNAVLQTLLVLLKKVPPDDGRRLMVVGTTAVPHFLEDLGLVQAFSVSQSVSLLTEPEEIILVLRNASMVSQTDAEEIAAAISKPIGIKNLLMVAEMAQQSSNDGRLDVNVFLECLHTVGY
mmetsp:Transcript_5817/g.8434  ORF Transcript_5817/g.8434 Transcript_5817/m.8434 type:complete len:789 (-) Transcript_5817:119-2485(-)